MAYMTGTATDRFALLKQVCDFAALHGWTLLSSVGSGSGYSEAILRGIGSGSDQIFVGFQAGGDSLNDRYWFHLNGYTGYVPGAAFREHPGAAWDTSSGRIPASLQLWNSGAIPFWLVVNGRRIVLVVKLGGGYFGCYLGFIMPYGTPGQYPYPLAIGGSTTGTSPPRYSDTSDQSNDFLHPTNFVSGSANTSAGSLWLRDQAGMWYAIVNTYLNFSTTRQARGVWPHNGGNTGTGNPGSMIFMRPNLDGSYPLLKTLLCQNSTNGGSLNVYGEFQGVFAVPGFQNAAENTCVIDGITYLILRNGNRTALNDFWALRLD